MGTQERADVTFRAATLDDVPEVLALVTSAYRGEPSRAGWTTEADLLDGQRTDPEGIAAIVTGVGGLVLVAAATGIDATAAHAEPAGRILACCQLEHHGTAGYFGMFAVVPTLQAAGLGSAVLAEAERYAREVFGADRMELQVIAQRADLIAWYVRRGYAPTGVMKPFPYGDERFGLPRRPGLAFTVLSKPL
nr:GNAT family N-acetyltransferase [Pseudofrankia sp. DC12]